MPADEAVEPPVGCRVKWLALRLGGQKWGVHIVSPRSKFLLGHEGEPLAGRCDYERSTIYLSRALGDEARDDTLLHECLHALLYVTGADGAYRRNHAVDERIVAALTPALHRLLIDLGFVFPKGPAA